MDNANQSHEVEFSLIGALLRDGKQFSRIGAEVKADNFHNTICRDIFAAMEKTAAQSITIDTVTVGDQLARDGKLDSIIYDVFTARAALSKLRDTGNYKNIDSYAVKVRDYYGKRLTYEIGKNVAVWSKNGRRAIDIIADGKKQLDEIEAMFGSGSSRTVDAKTAASRAYDEAERASRGERKFCATELIDLDAYFKIRAGSLTIAAGRPGQGKSALIDTIGLNVARRKLKNNERGLVLILSMEMDVEIITARLLSQMSGVPATNILDGEMSADEWIRFTAAVDEFEKLPIKINDLPAMSISAINAEARQHLHSGEDDLLIVDYLQLAISGQNKSSRVDEVGAIARGLKVYAGTSKTPVIAAAQLSRAVEQRQDKRPQLSDLRESGSIEADADNILFIFDDEGDNDNNGLKNIIVAKQRNGATSKDKGDVIVRWNAPIMRFENASYKVENFK